MKFGLLSQWYDPEPGPASLPAALARGLVENGHDVEVVTGFPNYPTGRVVDGYKIRPRSTEYMDGVRVTRTALVPSHSESVLGRLLNYGSFSLSSTFLGLPGTFRNLDALWVNYSPVTIALPMMVQRVLRQTPTVVHVLDLWPDTLSAAGLMEKRMIGGRGIERLLNSVCNQMYRSSDSVAYISPGVGQVLTERGVGVEKLKYVPMWANEDVFRRPEIGSTEKTREVKVKLLYAGTLGHAQGLDVLIQAVSRIRDLPLVCYIAGSGTEESRLRDLASELDADNIEFLGRIPQDEMPQLMERTDLHFVSLNDDPLARLTMPSKLQAIMAAGGTIVGALPGDAGRIVEESGSGWVCPPGDVNLLEKTLREAVSVGSVEIEARGAAGRRYYEREFSLARGVRQIESLLVSAARKPNGD